MVLEALATLLNGAFAKFARDEQLDRSLDILRAERVFAAVDDQHATLGHEVVEGVGDDRVHRVHGLLADADLLFLGCDLFEDAEDVGVEGPRVAASLRSFRGSCLLLFLQLADRGTLDLALFVSSHHSYIKERY